MFVVWEYAFTADPVRFAYTKDTFANPQNLWTFAYVLCGSLDNTHSDFDAT